MENCERLLLRIPLLQWTRVLGPFPRYSFPHSPLGKAKGYIVLFRTGSIPASLGKTR